MGASEHVLDGPLRAAVDQEVASSSARVLRALESWEAPESLAALALTPPGATWGALEVAHAIGLTDRERSDRLPSLSDDWSRTSFWNAYLWPLELQLPPAAQADGDKARARSIADRLNELGVEDPATFILDRVARDVVTAARSRNTLPTTPDFVAFSLNEPDPEAIEASVRFAAGAAVVEQWRAAGCFD